MWASLHVPTRFCWKRTGILHNKTFISETKHRGHLFSFRRAAQAGLFEVSHGPIHWCMPVVMGYCKFSPASTLKRTAYLPALMMSPLLPSHPSQQWQDKGLLPGEPFWKAQPLFLDSVPIMTDTQRTTSHKASQWTGTHCLYVRARVSLLLITSWNTLWSCQMKKEPQRISERSIKVICFIRRNTNNSAWLKRKTEWAFPQHFLRVECWHRWLCCSSEIPFLAD